MKKLLQSGEDYLETILILKERLGAVRAVDIIAKLGYSKSSVSRAVNILKDNGFIEVDSGGLITFTEKGAERSKSIYQRHKTLTNFLISLGVSEEVAAEDACKIEHYLSEESFSAIERSGATLKNTTQKKQ